MSTKKGEFGCGLSLLFWYKLFYYILRKMLIPAVAKQKLVSSVFIFNQSNVRLKITILR